MLNPDEEDKFCTRCGAVNSKNDAYCKSCRGML